MSYASDVRASYRRSFADVGEAVTLRRVQPSPPGPVDAQVLARVTGFSPQELASGIDEGSRKVLVLAEDVERAAATGWPVPIVKGDRFVVRGRVLVVESVDDSTRAIAGVLMAYEITASGS